MGAVTDRAGLARFAAAEPNGFGLSSSVGFRCDTSARVRTVAKRLISAAPTSTPSKGLSLFNICFVRECLSNDWFGHL